MRRTETGGSEPIVQRDSIPHTSHSFQKLEHLFDFLFLLALVADDLFEIGRAWHKSSTMFHDL